MADQGRESVLIIFVKRPERGKVKTRLAATIGDERAVSIYRLLLERTLEVVRPLNVTVQVHYGSSPEPGDLWERAGYERFSQQGSDLGARMSHAVHQAFCAGYRKVAIMGSDCYQLDTKLVDQAFLALDSHAGVIGPSTDGGYYLLGLSQETPEVFQNKSWSTDTVAEDTRSDFRSLALPYYELPALTDVDTEGDLHTIDSNRLAAL